MRLFAWLGVPVFVCVVSCGGAAGEVVKPKDFKGAEALGADVPVCKGKPAFARPLTVDLDSDTRSDLEASMKKGLVVVAYDCKELRVLSNCTAASGDYEYGRVDRKEEVVRIKDAGDLKANLPIGAAKLAGEISNGRSVDIALVSIGRSTTTTFAVPKSELKGRCDGATHFVQKAFVGAFAMTTESNGKVAAVAEMFSKSVGVSSSSSTERSGARSDGSLEACRKAENDAPSPTPECRTALRVELTPLEDDGKPKAPVGGDGKQAKRNVEVEPNPCHDGRVLVDGICTAPASATKGFLCDPTKMDECKAQCEKGNLGSCSNAGAIAMSRFGYGDATFEKASGEAMPFFKKACDGGDQVGCAGILRASLVTEEKQFAELLPVGKKACDAGVASACAELAELHHPVLHADDKWANAETSAKYAERACTLGDGFACGMAGKFHLEKDVNRGITLYRRGCDGGDARVCIALAKGYLEGKKSIPKDADKGTALAKKGCDLALDQCAGAADAVDSAGRHEDAFRLALRGCEEQEARTFSSDGARDSAKEKQGNACFLLSHYYEHGTGTKADPAKAAAAKKSACEKGDTRACEGGGKKRTKK